MPDRPDPNDDAENQRQSPRDRTGKEISSDQEANATQEVARRNQWPPFYALANGPAVTANKKPMANPGVGQDTPFRTRKAANERAGLRHGGRYRTAAIPLENRRPPWWRKAAR